MACSQHGELIEGKCVCDPGWSSIGDFSPIAGIDCDINILAIKITGFASFTIGFFSFAYYVYFFYQRLMTASNTKYGKKDYFAAVFLLCFLSIEIIALLSALDEEEVVGISPGKTFLVSIGYLTCLCGATIFFEAVLDLLVGIAKVLSIDAQTRVQESTQTFNSRAKALYTMYFLDSFIPLCGLGAPLELYTIVGRVYYILMAVMLGVFLMLFNPPVSLLRKELALTIRNQIENSKPGEENPLTNSLKDIRANMTIVQDCVNTTFGFGVFLLASQGSWYFMLRKSSYLILYCCIVINITSVPMLATLTYKSKKTNTAAKTPSSSKYAKISPTNVPPAVSSSHTVIQGEEV